MTAINHWSSTPLISNEQIEEHIVAQWVYQDRETWCVNGVLNAHVLTIKRKWVGNMINVDNNKGFQQYVYSIHCAKKWREEKFKWYFCVAQIVNISIYLIQWKFQEKIIKRFKLYRLLGFIWLLCARNSFITIVNRVVNLFGWPLSGNHMRSIRPIHIPNFIDGQKLNQIL